MCKRLVELMDGQIWVESSGVVGEGCTFHFEFKQSVSPNAFNIWGGTFLFVVVWFWTFGFWGLRLELGILRTFRVNRVFTPFTYTTRNLSFGLNTQFAQNVRFTCNTQNLRSSIGSVLIYF